MTLFDSLCHAFGTVSTSGYSTYNDGVAHFASVYIDWVIIVFMFLGGTSFVLLYRVARGEYKVLGINTEIRWYVGLTGALCGASALSLWHQGTYGWLDSVRYGTFQVVSLLTTTGFTTANYELWPAAAQMFLVAACFVGACAGSTGSGIKIVHIAIVYKFIVSTVKKLTFQPLAVVSVRLDGLPVNRAIIDLALCYFIVNIIVVLGGGCTMVVLDDMDPASALSAIVATLMNIGPGFGSVGPADNFAHISILGKWFLSLNMLVGRLDMFSVLVLLYPSFWRR
jgi:trk system potassium uptake protein TrkH